MKCLITGANGFVGTHLLREIKGHYPEIYGLSLHAGTTSDYIPIDADIRDTGKILTLIHDISPDVIFHLAGQPFVPFAMEHPEETLEINVKGTLNILHALQIRAKKAKMIYISSADVYGISPDGERPISEDFPPRPSNPYSASKLAGEVYCLQYSRLCDFLEIMIARPFNHIGVGQRDEFVVPNFFRQVMEAGSKKENQIYVGDLSSTRDFLDVRDVVRAYRVIAQKGSSGEIYNICSGTQTSIRNLLQKIIEICKIDIQICTDPSRFRKSETPRLIGLNTKIKSLGWTVEYSLEKSLDEIYKNLIS
ncbi:MAG: GDP-mannose 4,6-dehydratase [Leptospira sp.]|nr:GDP-mannose 4,6-dehydratase [Leptospira sp.]